MKTTKVFMIVSVILTAVVLGFVLYNQFKKPEKDEQTLVEKTAE